jgi:hypothetical protein
MALTEYQRVICRLIARQRVEGGESYIAGAAALNALTNAPRISRDIDLFHDTTQAVTASWEADRALLKSEGYAIDAHREREGFVEAEVWKDNERVIMQWTADSAFRFFPLIEHEDFGLTLHPFDLATNKVLALVGRLEARDWVDVINCDERIQPLGYLAWAASGKDPGFGPAMILEQSGRTHYSTIELAVLDFAGAPPEAAELSQKWHAMLAAASEIVSALPPSETGKCVLDRRGNLFRGDAGELRQALHESELRFHAGTIRGVLPTLR